MATAAQIAANRSNARRSTGPRTDAGREKAKLNAIKHGLAASTSVFLPHEDPLRYHEMRGALMETWQPANAQELLLVDQICQAWWATERSGRFQNAFFANQLRTMKNRNHVSEAPNTNDDEGIAVSMSDPANEAGFRTLYRYDDRAWSKYYPAIDRLRKLQADRRKLEAGASRPRPEPQPEPVPEEELTNELASFGETRIAHPSPHSCRPQTAPESPVADGIRAVAPPLPQSLPAVDRNSSKCLLIDWVAQPS